MNAIEFLKFLKEQPSKAALFDTNLYQLCHNIKSNQKTNYKNGTVQIQMISSKEKIFFS